MKAVFFDLFETLITEKTRKDFQARAPFHERLGTTKDKSSLWWSKNEDAAMIGKFPDCLARFTHLCKAVGSPLTKNEIVVATQEHEAWKSKVLSCVEPQIFKMLRKVRARGLKVGIMSNALPEEVLAWEFCPLQDHVDPVVFSCSVGVMKPDRKIFELACSRMCVQPSEAYFVGDGGYDELQDAASVGMRVIQAAWYQDRDVEWSGASPLGRADSIRNLPELLC
ncbi:MAG: HAD-IA family hydrolase [Candidatus Poribacteria bacterium]|nr:HAD-IA family hydrolase [Candidatus Poribacteria bacterium]